MSVNISALEVRRAELDAQQNALQNQINAGVASGTLRGSELDALAARQESLLAQLAEVNRQISRATLLSTQPTVSVGQVAQDDNTTGIQNPATPSVILNADGRINNATNASGLVTVQGITDSELATLQQNAVAAPTRTIEQTQGTPQPPQVVAAGQSNQLPNASQVGIGATPAYTSPGVGAAPDDNTRPNNNTTQQAINSTFGGPITPRPNILDQYVSYTYSISWYLITPNQFKALSNSKNTAGWQLLMQSGGAPVAAPGSTVGGRNQYFSLDYYLDNLVIHSKSMKGTGMAHNATDISFTVTEPNGITLIQTLYNAVSNVWKSNPTQYAQNSAPNYISNPYCLVIRFYGYDANGNLVTVGKNSSTGTSAIVEKFYPFLLTDLTFRVANKAVEYAIKAKPLPYSLNLSQARGTIPFNYELVGSTVDEVLNGRAVTVATTDPGARTTSTQPQTSAPSVVGNTISSNSNTDLGTGLNISTSFIGA